MATITNSGLRIYLCAALALGALAAHGQAYTPPPPPLTTAPCVPTKKDPCNAPPVAAPKTNTAADKFPFPGDAPGAPAPATPAAKQFPFPGEPGDAAPKTPAATPDAAKKFPFPGEPDEGSSSSSSSSSSSDTDAPADSSAADPVKPGLKDKGSTGSTRFERRKIVAPEDTDHRELEDLEVSHYYMTTGNFVAAYARAQDALRLYPDDENAHYALAVSAEKLKKYPEAAAEYRAYLKMAPDGEKVKQAQKALEMLPADKADR